jgi:hypothetical protein
MSTPNPTQPAAPSVGSPPVASGLTSQEAEAAAVFVAISPW